MKQKIILTLLFMMLSAQSMAVIDHECQQNPLPPNIDCPNDEFFDQQWAADFMDFPYGWFYTKGTARMTVFESAGYYDIYSEIQKKNLRSNGNGFFSLTNTNSCSGCTETEKFNRTTYSSSFPLPLMSHGVMLMGLLGNKNNNLLGTSGFCINCSLSYVVAEGLNPRLNHDYYNDPLDNCKYTTTTDDGFGCVHEALDAANNPYENALRYQVSSGAQIINMSFTLSDKLSVVNNRLVTIDENSRDIYASCDEQFALYGHRQEFCNILYHAKQKDVFIVVSAGNDKHSEMAWPANDNNVVGVVGTDPFGNLWSKDTCPSPNLGTGQQECGTNFDWQKSKFAAPADNVLVYHPSGDYSSELNCKDSNFLPINDGYQQCSGTSFSAPILSSVIAMTRSINPLLSVDAVKQILWDARVQNLPDQRYAIPMANKSVELSLGVSNGNQVENRLTPMFRMKTRPDHNYPNQISYLSTTIPQIGIAAQQGTYLVKPRTNTGKININDEVNYSSDVTSPLVSGYHKFSQVDRAPFYVFGGHRNPFTNSNDLLPLHHMVRDEFFGGANNTYCSELADHAYSTKRSNGFTSNNFCTSYYGQQYKWEGIDGYIMPNCPNGVDCYETTGNPNDAQCLKLRYSIQDNSFALMMASEINKPIFQSYGVNYRSKFNQLLSISTLQGMSNAECLGYVFPNVDSDNDGIIDGMELVLGTDPDNSDTDGDNYNDGYEYPLAGIPRSDPLTFDAGAPNCSKEDKGC